MPVMGPQQKIEAAPNPSAHFVLSPRILPPGYTGGGYAPGGGGGG
jgi:hypothetical protein